MVEKEDLRIIYDPEKGNPEENYNCASFFVENIKTNYRYSKKGITLDKAYRQYQHILENIYGRKTKSLL